MFQLQYVATGRSVELVNFNFVILGPLYRRVQHLWLLFLSPKFFMIQLEVTKSNLK
jgi:hypothetical protein